MEIADIPISDCDSWLFTRREQIAELIFRRDWRNIISRFRSLPPSIFLSRVRTGIRSDRL